MTMRLLLDTHIWTWWHFRPEKLSRAVARQIESPKNELFLSPVSVWEASHMHARGKMRIKVGFSEWLAEALVRAPLREAPFNFAVAAECARIRLPQSDFGDVVLAATASVFDLTLVTADTQLINCSWLKTLANE
jgi:PIN domain nuclease of toxin-antitoxin system